MRNCNCKCDSDMPQPKCITSTAMKGVSRLEMLISVVIQWCQGYHVLMMMSLGTGTMSCVTGCLKVIIIDSLPVIG